MTKKRWMYVGSAVFMLMVVVAAAVLGCGGEDQAQLYELVDQSTRDETTAAKTGQDSDLLASTPGEEGLESLTADAEGEAAISPGSSTLPQLQLKVIKTALVEMEMAKGDYAGIREDAVAATSAAGGFVESESASKDDDGLTYATLTLRIPAEKFDEVVTEVSNLGEVVSTQVSTNDVSAEYVDLESRLRHLQAEESFYLSLIGEAQTIQEMITIQEHLDAIQLEKEQVQGRMNFLDQQSGYSTLTLSVDEVAPDEQGEGFWNSVGDAFKSFGRGLKKLALGFFYALPYLVILIVLVVAAWLLVRRNRKRNRPSTSSG